MRMQRYKMVFAWAALVALAHSGVAAGTPRTCTALVRVSVEPYLYLDGACGFVTPCGALVFVPPPWDSKLKTAVTSFTLSHNEGLDVSAWRCGGPGSGSQAPKEGANVLYNIEFIASGATTPFYTRGFAPLPSLTPVRLTTLSPSQSRGTVTVRVTRQATKATWLQGDWLTLQFNRP